jgi:hypothetical protein
MLCVSVEGAANVIGKVLVAPRAIWAMLQNPLRKEIAETKMQLHPTVAIMRSPAKSFHAPNFPKRGFSRVEAASYVGISPTKFDQLVADGRMPKAKHIDGRKVWDVRELDPAFDDLGNLDTSWDDVG